MKYLIVIIYLLVFVVFGDKAMSSELKSKLTQLQYHVTQEKGTEKPFHNEYWDNHRDGIYVDVVSGDVLFSSKDKYDSGTGWPSFSKTLNESSVATSLDKTLGMERSEIKNSKSGTHLGHVFNDGPGSDRKRFCVNSASLRFIPKEKMKDQGYGDWLFLFEKKEVATFGAGCFWGVEHLIKNIKGVIKTTVGYEGGQLINPDYGHVKKGNTGHAEVVQIEFDPSVISYKELLAYFWRLHDPTQLNRQGHDVGTQYRSVIFYHNLNQKMIAEKSKKDFDDSHVFKEKSVTQILAQDKFWKAEEYHQHYLDKNPQGYMCHIIREK